VKKLPKYGGNTVEVLECAKPYYAIKIKESLVEAGLPDLVLVLVLHRFRSLLASQLF
jgi:hypothetical protein